MEVRPIRTEKDHKAALAEIEACWGAPEGSEKGDRLDVLLALAEIYEAKRWPVKTVTRFDPIDVLNYAIDDSGTPRQNWASYCTPDRVHRKFSPGGVPLQSI